MTRDDFETSDEAGAAAFERDSTEPDRPDPSDYADETYPMVRTFIRSWQATAPGHRPFGPPDAQSCGPCGVPWPCTPASKAMDVAAHEIGTQP